MARHVLYLPDDGAGRRDGILFCPCGLRARAGRAAGLCGGRDDGGERVEPHSACHRADGGRGRLPPFLPAAAGIVLGALLLALLDEFTRQRGGERVTHSDFLLLSAITLHNIPEGMAVGLAFALAADGDGLAGAAALALGIGVQNFPEGAAVALPLYQSGQSKLRAFVTGVLSGAVEPLFGVLVVLAAARVHALMPWLLSFAAGAMLYVVAEELLPRAGSRRGTCGFLVGFLFMMVLDVALG